jgi:hypothetical protein
MKRTQKGDLRDKMAVRDPAAAPAEGDAEAGGAGMRGAARGADRHQAHAARQAVPTLDASRAVSTAEYPGKRRYGALGPLAAAGVLVGALVGVALWLTLPGF